MKFKIRICIQRVSPVFRMAEGHTSVTSLQSFGVNSTNVSQNDLLQSLSSEKHLKLLDYLFSIVKSREFSMRSKSKAPIESSRYLGTRNTAVVEKDHGESLCELYVQWELCYIFDDIFQRNFESTILWDIVKENVTMEENSFSSRKPPIENAPKLERSILNSMANIADESVKFEETHKDTYKVAVEHLDMTRRHVDQLEKFRLFKAKLNQDKEEVENQSVKDMRERQRKMIKTINTVRGIVSNLIGSGQINYLEHPEIVEIIRRCRKIVTEENLEKESSFIMSTISQSDN